MDRRLVFAASALARLVLVLVAFGLAVGSIVLSSVRGFCPEGIEGALTAATDGVVAEASLLATIVEETEAPGAATAPEPAPTAPTAPGDGAPEDGAPEDGATAPAEEGGACPGGVSRCLPPLFSSVLILGDEVCNDEAPARLRSRLVPAFVGSTALLAAAWWLRPGRLHGRTEAEQKVDSP